MKQAASEQERLIGELAARGFGAQFLYKPLPYFKGQPGHLEKEPFDLAWVVEGFVALFYLNESTASLEKQIRHNAKGPYGFIRLWASGDERFVLPGKNIFGDEIRKPFSEVTHLLTISIVSCPCGPRLFETNTHGKIGCTLVVPEELVARVARVNGTIIDLLKIAVLHQELGLTQAPTLDEEYYLLDVLSTRYLRESLFGKETEESFNAKFSASDQWRVWNGVMNYKSPLGATRQFAQTEHRELLGAIFCDFSLAELSGIIHTVLNVFKMSGAPRFTHYAIAKAGSEHYAFVVYSLNLNSSPVEKIMDQVLQAMKPSELGPPGVEAILLGYTYYGEGIDYFSPGEISLPRQLPRRQSLVLVERLAALASGRPMLRKPSRQDFEQRRDRERQAEGG